MNAPGNCEENRSWSVVDLVVSADVEKDDLVPFFFDCEDETDAVGHAHRPQAGKWTVEAVEPQPRVVRVRLETFQGGSETRHNLRVAPKQPTCRTDKRVRAAEPPHLLVDLTHQRGRASVADTALAHVGPRRLQARGGGFREEILEGLLR